VRVHASEANLVLGENHGLIRGKQGEYNKKVKRDHEVPFSGREQPFASKFAWLDPQLGILSHYGGEP
jgi:hypothetical protein